METETQIEIIEAYRVNGQVFTNKEEAEVEAVRQDLIELFVGFDGSYKDAETSSDLIVENINDVFSIIKRIRKT